MPLAINQKMIDEQRFAGFLTRLRQLRVMTKHVDERRLADITAPDKSVLRQIALRTILYIRRRDDVYSCFYHKCRWKPSGAIRI